MRAVLILISQGLPSCQVTEVLSPSTEHATLTKLRLGLIEGMSDIAHTESATGFNLGSGMISLTFLKVLPTAHMEEECNLRQVRIDSYLGET